jgi:L-lactate dehydrogenase complex protein LldE
VDAVRNLYGDIFADSPALRDRLEVLGQRTYEFCEYLHKVLELSTLPPHPQPSRTTYHSSCRTLRGLGLRGVAERYLKDMLGDSFLPLPESDTCCGFGGSFSVKLPEISGKLMADKLENIRSTGASVVSSLDLSCLTHLSGGAGRHGLGHLRFLHLAEIMAEAIEGRIPCP